MSRAKPEKGDLAICSQGHLGVITHVAIVQTRNRALKVYHGHHLSKQKLGFNWQSREPKVVGHVNDLVRKYCPCPKKPKSSEQSSGTSNENSGDSASNS